MATTMREAIRARTVGLRARPQPANAVAWRALLDEATLRKQSEQDGDVAGEFVGAELVKGIIPARALRVLIVDDNRDFADVSAILFRCWGHEPRVAYNGAEALELVATFQPDVFLMDVGLPRMSGCELARRLRAQRRFQETLLIAITGYADSAHRLLGEEAGFDVYLVKPVDPSILETLLLLELNRLTSSPIVATLANGKAFHDSSA